MKNLIREEINRIIELSDIKSKKNLLLEQNGGYGLIRQFLIDEGPIATMKLAKYELQTALKRDLENHTGNWANYLKSLPNTDLVSIINKLSFTQMAKKMCGSNGVEGLALSKRIPSYDYFAEVIKKSGNRQETLNKLVQSMRKNSKLVQHLTNYTDGDVIYTKLDDEVSKIYVDDFMDHLQTKYPGLIDNSVVVPITPKPKPKPISDPITKVNLSKQGELFLNAINTSPESFYTPNRSTSDRMSGWKFHIFGDEAIDSALIADKIHNFCVQNNCTYKIATSKGYRGGIGTKSSEQYGKAVTVYIPTEKIPTVKEFLAQLQSKLLGYEKKGKIVGDLMITDNIGYRYELSQPVDPTIGVDNPTYYKLYTPNRGDGGDSYNIPGNPDIFQLREPSVNVSKGVENPKVILHGNDDGLQELTTGGNNQDWFKDPRGKGYYLGQKGEYKQKYSDSETSINILYPAVDKKGRWGNVTLSVIVPNSEVDKIDMGLLRTKFDSEIKQIMKEYGMVMDFRFDEKNIPRSRWKQLQDEMINFVKNPVVAQEPVQKLDINQGDNNLLWTNTNDDITGYKPNQTPVAPEYIWFAGKRVSNRSYVADDINWNKMDPNYNRNLLKLNQNIAKAIVKGDWYLVPIGGFEKFGVRNFREYLMNNIKSVNEVNPSTGRWSVNFKESGSSNLPKTSGVPEDKSNAQRNSFGGYSGSN